MADASIWADDIRTQEKWGYTAPWHYVNVPDGQTYKASRKSRDGDVLVAVERYRRNLKNRSNSPVQRADALRFLIHFIGDLHQPLHVGRAEDRGGNQIQVEWFGRPSNLHWVWDAAILDHAQWTEATLAAAHELADEAQMARWVSSGPLDWANESQALRSSVYALGNARLAQPYYDASLPIVRKRILQAGVRLAAFLEKALR